jgi:hypothetical protein
MTRIYERQTDALFAAALADGPEFAGSFLAAVDRCPDVRILNVKAQTPHRGEGHRGTIDLEVTCSDGTVLLIENKIDAGYSVTRTGDPQPERYKASVAALRDRGLSASSVLLAPEVYLAGTRHRAAFDHSVSYEALRNGLRGADLALLDAAILQASTPYDPLPNPSSAAFSAEYEAFARKFFPELALKRNPNGNGVRPTRSQTIYFDVPRLFVPGPCFQDRECPFSAGTVPPLRHRSRSCSEIAPCMPMVSGPPTAFGWPADMSVRQDDHWDW